MGGAAFPDYNTPRMTPTQYTTLRDHTIALLLTQKFYTTVLCPPEAPGKTTHGDVDLLATEPLRPFTPSDLSTALGAVARTKTGPTTSFCVPLPPSPSTSTSTSDPSPAPLYAQLDIHVVATRALLPWTLFIHSYGDLAQMLGRLQRPLGLTATDRGLHVRIAAIEARNRRAAMLFLTRDPAAVMAFLGLDARRFERGFATEDEVFAWVARGRFFASGLLLLGRGRTEEGGEKAADRARVAKRAMYARFVGEWAPAHPEAFGAGGREWGREEVLVEALEWFGGDVRGVYDGMVQENEAVVRAEALMERIRAALPVEGDRMGLVLKGVKRWVGFVDGRLFLRPEDQELGAIAGLPEWIRLVRTEDEEGVVQFVLGHWETLLLREKKRASNMKAAKGPIKPEAQDMAALAGNGTA